MASSQMGMGCRVRDQTRRAVKHARRLLPDDAPARVRTQRVYGQDRRRALKWHESGRGLGCPTTPRRTQGGSGSRDSQVVPGEPPYQAQGRSRGEVRTKVYALADRNCTPLLAMLTPGQAGDNPMLTPLIEALAESGDTLDFRLLADKAREPTCATGDPAHHLERSDQIAYRKTKGIQAGRRAAFDAAAYKHRSTVERSLNRLKQ